MPLHVFEWPANGQTMLKPHASERAEAGATMIETLVAIVILAFGLLGLAAFQLRAQTSELEAFQRAQALVLINDMATRIHSNRANAASYVSSSLGTGSPTCTPVAGTPAGDQCEWSNLLKGNAERTAGGSNIGVIVGARGCVTELQAAVNTPGACRPAIYEVSVAWQGMTSMPAPNTGDRPACGAGNYGSDDLRRVAFTRVSIATLTCTES